VRVVLSSGARWTKNSASDVANVIELCKSNKPICVLEVHDTTGCWINDTKNAIIAMRNAGFHHTLMVGAPNWGRDWQFIMRNNPASVFDSDPDRNTIFSVHRYGVFDTAAEIQSYLSAFVTNALPLVIWEFGWYHTDGDPDEDVIMAQAQSFGIGYLGWSWSGSGGGVEYLDMASGFDPAQPTTWGTRIIAGANGLQQTSQECSVYRPDLDR
jgi:mannan endo-1,4-beta-mannosidase